MYLLITLLASLPAVHNIPVRGNFAWSVVLCKFYDEETVPKPREYFDRWFTDTDALGSIPNFLNLISNGLYTIHGTNIHGWLTMPYRKSVIRYLANSDPRLARLYPSHSTVQLKFLHKIKELCIETGRASTKIDLHKNVIAVINDEHIAMFCSNDGILLTPSTITTSALVHEMIHSYNIGHSYSDRVVNVYPYSELGEYDDKYDLMSTGNAHMFGTSFGMAGPGLSGPHLDFLGWLPANRILYFGKDGEREAVVRLDTLSRPHKRTSGYLFVIIPIDRDDAQTVLTLEMRSREGPDRHGIPRDATLLIHEYKRRERHIFTHLLSHGSNRRQEWIENDSYRYYIEGTDDRQFVDIKIDEINASEGMALVTIRTEFDPVQCKEEQVHRLAYPDDKVCVSPSERQRIRTDMENAHQYTSHITGQCLPGASERRTNREDNTCISQQRASMTQSDNERWQGYLHFFDKRTYGLNACDGSFVWRLIDAYDYACVSEDTLRKTTLGIEGGLRSACRNGTVERLAFSGDFICVSPEESKHTQEETWLGKKRLAYRKFMNGIDTLN